MTHYLRNPESIQIELSSNCNSLCHGCCRQDSLNLTQVDPRIPKNKFLDIEIFKKVITAKSFQSLQEVFFCGSIDDPIMHPKFYDFVEWVLVETDLRVLIDTNGGARSVDWWRELGKLNNRFDSRCITKLNVDGLNDTNHKFRQFTRFDRIMNNAKAFIDAGGHAYWQYIVFPWNKHQIDEAKELSISMGFKNFRLRANQVIDLDLPYDDALIQLVKSEQERKDFNWDQYVKAAKTIEVSHINCRRSTPGADELSYMLSYNGELWPCCFLYNARYQGADHPEHITRYETIYGKNWNNVYVNDVDEILAGPFFNEHLTKSWSKLDTVGGLEATDCSAICIKNCGKK